MTDWSADAFACCGGPHTVADLSLDDPDAGHSVTCRAARKAAREHPAVQTLLEYVQHASWRCTYRSRYGKCQCGLDDTLASIGLPPVPVQDPDEPYKVHASSVETVRRAARDVRGDVERLENLLRAHAVPGLLGVPVVVDQSLEPGTVQLRQGDRIVATLKDIT